MAFGPKKIGISIPKAALPAMPAVPAAGAGGGGELGAHGFSLGHDAGMGADVGSAMSQLKMPAAGGKQWQGGAPWKGGKKGI